MNDDSQPNYVLGGKCKSGVQCGYDYCTRYIWDLAGMELEVMLGRTLNAKQIQQPTAAVWEE